MLNTTNQTKPNQREQETKVVSYYLSKKNSWRKKNTTLIATGFFARKKLFGGNEANFMDVWITASGSCARYLSMSGW